MLFSSKLIFFLISSVLFVVSKSNVIRVSSEDPTKVSYVILSNGQKLPAVGYGTAFSLPINLTEVENAVKKAVDVGFRHFDCASAYLTEEAVGKALNDKIKEGVVTREELFIVSKLWFTENKQEKVVPACKRSAIKMGLEYFDSYLVHFPFSEPNGVDYLETWRGMEECARLGLTRSIGVSNFNTSQLQRLLEHAVINPVINQVEVHVNLSQNKMRDFCARNEIAVVAYSPLGSSNRNSAWQLPRNVTVGIKAPAVTRIAKKYGKTNHQVALRYLIDIGVVPVPHASKEKHMRDNINLFDFKLSDEEIASIDKLNINLRTNPALPYKNYTGYPFEAIES